MTQTGDVAKQIQDSIAVKQAFLDAGVPVGGIGRVGGVGGAGGTGKRE